MNTERLHAIALAIRADLDKTDAVATVQSLSESLKSQVGSPQEPSHQQAVSTALQTLQQALLEAPSNSFPPTWLDALDELGVADLLGNALASRVTGIFERNQITPSVASEELDGIATELDALTSGLDQLLAGLAHFNIGKEDLNPGEAEVGVLIPRPAVEEELQRLGDEFVEIQRLLGPFLELSTGSRPPLRVRTISSSDFSVFLDMAPKAAVLVAIAVERVVTLYKQLLEIRKLRQELADQGVPEPELAGVDSHANDHMSRGIDIAVDELLVSSENREEGRGNELRIELRLSMNAIANRIDSGYNIDVRADPPDEPDVEGEDEENREEDPTANALRRIVELSPKLTFINPSGKPILSLPETTQNVADGPDEDDGK